MVIFEFLAANRLNRQLDALVEQDPSAAPARLAAIDPDIAQTAVAVQRLTMPKPDAEFAEGLLRDILAG